MTDVECGSDIVHARFDATLPPGKWIARHSRAYPGLSFSVLSMLASEGRAGNVLFQVEGTAVQAFLREFTSSVPVTAFQVLHESPGLVLLHVTMDEPLLVSAFVEASVPVKYPIRIAGGEASIEIVAPRDRIDALLDVMARAGFVPRLRRIGPYEGHAMLSPRHRAILEAVHDGGYFEVPRRSSLTAIAASLGISASTLSETIRRIFKKLSACVLRGA